MGSPRQYYLGWVHTSIRPYVLNIWFSSLDEKSSSHYDRLDSARRSNGGRAVVAKGPLYKTTKEAKVAAEALGCTKINETVHNGQAVVRKEIHTLPGILMGTTEGPGKWLRQLRI